MLRIAPTTAMRRKRTLQSLPLFSELRTFAHCAPNSGFEHILHDAAVTLKVC
jgi:hypothetical protein